MYDQLEDPLSGLPEELAAPFRALRGLEGFLGRCTIDRHGGIVSIECPRGEWFMRAAASYTCRHVALDGPIVGPRLFSVGRYLHTICRVPGARLLLIVQRRERAVPELSRRAASRVARALSRYIDDYVDEHDDAVEFVEIALNFDDEPPVGASTFSSHTRPRPRQLAPRN